MKTIIHITFLFSFFSLIGQSGEYKYLYEFTVEKSQPKSILLIDTLEKKHQTGLKIIVTDQEENILPGAQVLIESTENKESKTTDDYGAVNIQNPPTKGIITVNYVGHETASFKFYTLRENIIVYKIGLVINRTLNSNYEIHSKRKIKRKERQQIIECIKKCEDCSICKTEDYYIVTHL